MPNPKVEQLALGRGKRSKLDHNTVSMRMSLSAQEALEVIANRYYCLYALSLRDEICEIVRSDSYRLECNSVSESVISEPTTIRGGLSLPSL